MTISSNSTIAAIATSHGVGAIAVIRLSGARSISIADKVFKGKKLALQKSHTAHFGLIIDENDNVIDEVLITIFKAPSSYTGEDVVEISCHGAPYIAQRILELLIRQGAEIAKPGEFTQRAFLNGKMDLAQAEAVADLIAAESRAAQQTAIYQLRGGYSNELKQLRDRLINFASLIELELDFSDEDVVFADRQELSVIVAQLKETIQRLIDSFSLGNAIKKGISVAIIGAPNAGKSTLLNALLNEERAIVSDIAGTTRDALEETLNIQGVIFRLIDTAGIRSHTTDAIESIGIERSRINAQKADIILLLIDSTQEKMQALSWLDEMRDKTIEVDTKIDKLTNSDKAAYLQSGNSNSDKIAISAKTGQGIDQLKETLYNRVVGNSAITDQTIITNARHHEALLHMMESLNTLEDGLQQGITSDLLAIDIRRILYYLGTITGQVEVDRDILGAIFGKFCIGK